MQLELFDAASEEMRLTAFRCTHELRHEQRLELAEMLGVRPGRDRTQTKYNPQFVRVGFAESLWNSINKQIDR
jgi:hypothetical protein